MLCFLLLCPSFPMLLTLPRSGIAISCVVLLKLISVFGLLLLEKLEVSTLLFLRWVDFVLAMDNIFLLRKFFSLLSFLSCLSIDLDILSATFSVSDLILLNLVFVFVFLCCSSNLNFNVFLGLGFSGVTFVEGSSYYFQ